MEGFAAVAVNASQPVSGVFAAAAQLVDGVCGASFVNATVDVRSSSGAAGGVAGRGGGFAVMALAAALVVVAL